jgi:hypothetical protein
MLRYSPSQKEKDAAAAIAADQENRSREYYDPVHEWTIQMNFRFPPPLLNDGSIGSSERFRVIHEVPAKNTSLYYLLSQSNPWLDCEMTREKRAYLKPRVGEMCCAVYAGGASNGGTSSSHVPPNFFRNETVMDIVNLYLWPLLYSRADDVIACQTFGDWKRLFTRTISLAFPDYEYWTSIAVCGTMTPATMSTFVPISDQRRTARLLKYMTPARVLYLLTTRANFWPYGPSSLPRPRITGVSGLCSIKPRIKEYAEKTEIQWLVNADFLRKMKRVHLYIIHANSDISTSLNDTDSE